MPLMKSGSKKAFEHNVKAEIEAHPEKRKQDLAIAYSIKRKNAHKAPKKMANGGMADESAKSEQRPIPKERDKDAAMVSHNSSVKAPVQDSWTNRPDVKQSTKGMRVTPIKHPKFVPSNVLQTRLFDEEDDLQKSAKVNNGPQIQPPEDDNELDADKHGHDLMDKSSPHSKNLNRYAKGGPVMEPMDHDEEEMERHDESDLEDHEAPSEDEGAAEARNLDELDQDAHGDDVPDMEDEHSTHRKPYAHGGLAHEMDMQPHDEEMEEERHNSIAAAIMAKKARQMHLDSGASDEDMAEMDEDARFPEEDRMYAEGGEILEKSKKPLSHDSIYAHPESDQADLARNAEEDANEEDQMSFNALRKENYSESEGLHQLDSPMDSNEHSDPREDEEENKHDMISRIRSKMALRKQFR